VTLIAQAVLFGWIPFVVVLFSAMPPRRALVAATIAGWLSLPNVKIFLPGVPDYSKLSATVMGMLLGSALFDSGRLLRFKPRWIDLPMASWCIVPFFTAISNGLGAYDGISQMLEMTMQWGMPYLLGRVYLSDLAGLRELALGIVVGGLVYVPFCLFESRMSPQLQNWLYGFSMYWEGMRWGGYRPKVFMTTGLELGMWMTAATVVGYWLWTSNALTRLWGVPFGLLLLVLSGTTVLCRSTGALLLLVMAAGGLFVVRWTRMALPILALVLIPPVYMALRAPGLLSRQPVLTAARMLFPEDRVSSLETRVTAEDFLAAKALQRPLLGWAGYGRSMARDDHGHFVLMDGMWIITLGVYGTIGLVSMTTSMLLPVALFIRRFPARTWTDPAIAPAAVLAVLLSTYMIDNLSNAFANLAYAIAIGGLSGLVASREGAAAVAGAGRAQGGVGPAPVRAPAFVDPRAEAADREDAAAELLWSQGRYDEAEHALRLARRLREEVAVDHPEVPEHFQDLALAFENLGRLLKTRGRLREAEDAWRQSLEIREHLAAEFPEDDEYRRRWAAVCNDLAWLLVARPGAPPDAAPRAIRLAEKSVELLPGEHAYWNTLGMAYYRGGHWGASAAALERSIQLDSGGTGFDHFVLAMAYRRLGRHRKALESYRLACRWLQEHKPGHAELLRLRDEASTLLGA
jgi:tetratricopeptide (TPR) repeat protein